MRALIHFVSAPEQFHANLQRGSLLLNHNRPREALGFIQAAIAANPEAAHGYAELARCWNELPGQRTKAIGAINRAIGLAPNASYYQGRKGWYLICLLDYRGGLRAAEAGLGLNPLCPQSLNALANAHTKLGQWKKAEADCRRILQLDPHNGPGLNLLAQALRYQGRWKECRDVVASLLTNMPNSAFGHSNAGYAALAAGDHLRANGHFLEALLLDPHCDLARRGLLQSLRARIWLTRINLRVASFGHRPATPLRVVAAAFGFLVVLLLLGLTVVFLENLHPNAGFIFLLVLIYGFFLYLGLSVSVGLIGSFLLLFDPVGRHALKSPEKARASLPVILFGLAVGVFLLDRQFVAAFAAVAAFTLVALSIQWPLWRDRKQLKRVEGVTD